jgi:DNA-directed RNA polymerase subunit RPC12/RpoP
MTNYFICVGCSKKVSYDAPGTKNRNHCPYCLASLHVDEIIGDRSSQCHGLMPAIGKFYKPDGEEMLAHKCQKCGQIRKNRVAGDDSYEEIDKLRVVDFESLT